MKTTAILTKVKWNKGKTENGQEYDYTRAVIQMPIYDNSANEFGVDMLECEYGLAAQHIDLLHFKGKLPCEVKCDIQHSMRRGKTVTLIANIELVASGNVKASS